MISSNHKSVEQQLNEIVEYIAHGEHAFVASDNKAVLDRVVAAIEVKIQQEPIVVLQAGDENDLRTFAEVVVNSCEKLLTLIASAPPPRSGSLAMHLGETERAFQKKGRQGYLVINHIDRIIELQNTFELEAPFREVMQFFNDVAIIWLGARDTIMAMHDPNRPFYLSHRVFWL